MSNNYWDEEDDDFDTEVNDNDTGSDLLKKLRKAKRADEKRIKELTEQLEGFSKKQREQIVMDILEQTGVNPKAARLILKDLDDVSVDSVNEWLYDNADLFGLEVEQDAPLASESDYAELRQQDMITQGAYTPDRAEDMEFRVNNAETADDLIALIRSQQS
jgi:hypothetical protein